MSDWEKIVEDGKTFYVHEECGNVMQLSNGTYVSMMPMVLRFGPFSSLEKAKETCENKLAVENIIENYNLSILKQKGIL